MKLTKRLLVACASIEEKRAETHRLGRKYVVARYGGTFGSGASKAEALAALWARLS